MKLFTERYHASFQSTVTISIHRYVLMYFRMHPFQNISYTISGPACWLGRIGSTGCQLFQMLFSFFLLTFNLFQAILQVLQCRQDSCRQIKSLVTCHKVYPINQSIDQSIEFIESAPLVLSRIRGATVCQLRCVSTVKKERFKIRSKSS